MLSAQSGSPSPAAEASNHWAPHGPLLTACLVGLNVLMIALIFFYFWRFFSRKRGPPSSLASADEAASSSTGTSPATSPRVSWRQHGRGLGLDQPQAPNIASSLPVSVYSSTGGGDGAADGGKAADCAVCIVEFRDGDLARLLPRCGHRFHAACVDAWLRLHATCPLCRAAVVAPAPAAAEPKNGDPKDGDAGAEEESPV